MVATVHVFKKGNNKARPEFSSDSIHCTVTVSVMDRGWYFHT
jgi:hypothetical protein